MSSMQRDWYEEYWRLMLGFISALANTALVREFKNLWNMIVIVIKSVISATETGPEEFGKETGRVGNKRSRWGHPNDRIIKTV